MTRLLQIITFTDVDPAEQVVLPHTLNINGVAIVPDIVQQDAADFSIDAVTSSTVTVTNNGADVATLNVWLERKHSITRQLGSDSATLSPSPFVAAVGSAGGGGGTVSTDASMFGDGSGGSPLRQATVGLAGAGTAPDPLTVVGSIRPTEAVVLFSDMDSYDNIQCWISAGGASVSQISAAGNNGNAYGQVNLTAANGADEAAAVLLGARRKPNQFDGDGNPSGLLNSRYVSFENYDRVVFSGRVWMTAAPALGNDFRTFVGMHDCIDASTVPNGAYFACCWDDYGNANWRAVVSGNVSDDADTGVAVDATAWHEFIIVWTLADETFRYYIDGVLVATLVVAGFTTTGMPGNVNCQNTIVGAEAARLCRVDWLYCGIEVDRS